MAKKFVWLLLLISIFRCGSAYKENENNGICSKEQIEKFEKCTKNYASFYDRTIREMGDKIPDSILNFYKDVRDLELPELITKYKVEKNQIDRFIHSVCVSNEIENAYQKLDKLSETNENLEESKKQLDSLDDASTFDYSKIKPINIDESKYIAIDEEGHKLNKNNKGEYYYLKRGDTIKVYTFQLIPKK